MAKFNSQVKAQIIEFNRYIQVLIKAEVKALPGQFFMFYADYIKKPFSVAYIDGKYLCFIIKPVGNFTKNLPSTFRLEGPYGNGFPDNIDNLTKNTNKTPLLISGGAGMAPILFLAQKLTQKKQHFTWYHGDKEDSLDILKNFPIYPDRIILEPEMVTDILDPFTKPPYLYFACGPKAMLKTTYDALGETGFVALEERMLCGYGACQSCVVDTITGYQQVCKEGPIFKAGDIKWS